MVDEINIIDDKQDIEYNALAQESSEAVDVRRIPDAYNGWRLDKALARIWPEYSRAQLQRWFKEGRVSCAGYRLESQRQPVTGGETIGLLPPMETETSCAPWNISLDIMYEDDDLLIINKPPGMVVHPGAGHREQTLQNALIAHCPSLEVIPRHGLIHRLDKDTSGLLVVAKSHRGHTDLTRAMKERTIHRQYIALVYGIPTGGFCIDMPIGRHAVDRTRMAVREGGRVARTHFRVLERYITGYSLLELVLETGRTHQIRVHLAAIRHPVAGDPLYAKGRNPSADLPEPIYQALLGWKRQALHAQCLKLRHPVTDSVMEWQAPIPDDLAALIALMRDHHHKEPLTKSGRSSGVIPYVQRFHKA